MLLTLIFLLIFQCIIVVFAQAEILSPKIRLPDLDNSSGKIFADISSPQNGSAYHKADTVFVNFTFNDVEIGPINPINPNLAVAEIGYSLDGGPIERLTNFTLFKTKLGDMSLTYFRYYSGNFSLSNLEIGNHSITIYNGYQHDFGNGKEYLVDAYANANFTVITPSPSPTPANPNLSVDQQSLALIGISAIAIVVCVGLIVYFKKRPTAA
jgi:hypothetical protein